MRQVESLDRRMLAIQADVRDLAAVEEAVRRGIDELGHVDFGIINHGITSTSPSHEMTPEMWHELIDINLTGVWNSCRAITPHLIAQESGVIVITSSVACLRGFAALSHYSAAKHGVVGLMRALAHELGPHGIRVNTVHPSMVETPMLMNQAMYDAVRPDLENPTKEDFLHGCRLIHALPVAVMEPRDISNAILFLCSDEARWITGVTLPIDGGLLA